MLIEVFDAPKFDLKYDFFKCQAISVATNLQLSNQKVREAIEIPEKRLLQTADAETLGWYRHAGLEVTTDQIEYSPFDNDAEVEFDKQQQWFNNIEYQREDLKGACKELGIPGLGKDTRFRMPGMALSQEFEFWQVVAVKGMLDIINKRQTLRRGLRERVSSLRNDNKPVAGGGRCPFVCIRYWRKPRPGSKGYYSGCLSLIEPR